LLRRRPLRTGRARFHASGSSKPYGSLVCCDAVKIRCRKRRTCSSTARQRTASQSRNSSSGPFTAPTKVAGVPNLSVGSGLVVIVSAQAHLTRVSPLSQPGTRPGIRPVIQGSWWRTRRAVLVSRCLSAAGISFSGHPSPARGARPSSRPAYRTPHGAGPRRGFHVPHLRATTGLGALSTPGTAVLSRPDAVPGQRLPHHNGLSLHPAATSHRAEPLFTRHQRRFTRFTRPVCPSPVIPVVGLASFGFPSGFAPRRYQQRTPRAGPGHEHAPGATPPTSCRPPISELARKVRPRVATA
jgi:hypothetical protein